MTTPTLRHRELSGQPAAWLAKHAGMTAKELQLLEREGRPTEAQALALARALRVPPWHFLEGCDCGQ